MRLKRGNKKKVAVKAPTSELYNRKLTLKQNYAKLGLGLKMMDQKRGAKTKNEQIAPIEDTPMANMDVMEEINLDSL